MVNNTENTYQPDVPEDDFFVEYIDKNEELKALSVEELLYCPISIEDQPYTKDITSPTPIDPYELVTNASSYYNGALMYMHGTFANRIQQLGIQLPAFQEQAIGAEIEMSHSFQLRKNSDTIKKLRQEFEENPNSFTLKQARAIYLERIGFGSSEQRLRIVAAPDRVDAIEDMKITAPLDERKILLGLQEYYDRLQGIGANSDIDIRFIPIAEQKSRLVDVSKTAHPGTLVTKRTIAVASVNNKIIDLRQKDSYVCIPLDVDLGDAVPVIRTINGVNYNIQHVAVSSYWAVQPPKN